MSGEGVSEWRVCTVSGGCELVEGVNSESENPKVSDTILYTKVVHSNQIHFSRQLTPSHRVCW